MSLENSKAIERSVDGVARIYAIVVGLALAESIKTFIARDPFSGNPDLSAAKLLSATPALIAFVVTLVPFWHGMNRHLDRCYLERPGAIKYRALLFDFSVFFLEAGLLFLAGWSLRFYLVTFYSIGSVLLLDTIWGFISHGIHFDGKKSHAKTWAIINLIAGVFSLIVVFVSPVNAAAWLLMFIAIGRTIADYKCGWEFYFPESSSPVE